MARFAPHSSSIVREDDANQAETLTTASVSSHGSGERLSDVLARHEPVATPETLDLRAAAARVPGGLPGVRRLAEVFLPECRELMATLAREIPEGDAPTAKRAAHTLKGSSDLFGGVKTRDLAFRLETMIREGELSSCGDLLQELQQEVRLMTRGLENFLEITADS